MKWAVILSLTAAIAVVAAYSVHHVVGSAASSRDLRVSTVGHPNLAYTRSWSASLDANADSAPIFVTGVRVGKATDNLVVLVAGNNQSDCDPSNAVPRATTYAFNAANGRLLWKRSTTGAGRCTTAGPAASGAWIYSPGLDGKVHKYSAATGVEYTKAGWPMPFTLMPDVEKASSALRISGKYLYVTTSGFIGDGGHYEGHVLTVNLANNTAHVFNSLCSNIHHLLNDKPGSKWYCPDVQSGMFGRGQATVDPVNGDVYVSTGNGPWNGKTNWGDSVLKLTPNGARLVDAFTPKNQAYLNDNDLDLGSTGPGLLPSVQMKGRTYQLATQAGKGPAGTSGPVAIYLLNRDNLSGKAAPGHLGGYLQVVHSPRGHEVLTAPAVWKSAAGTVWVYYANNSGLEGFSVRTSSGTHPTLIKRWAISGRFTTPVVSGNLLFVAQDGAIESLNTTTGAAMWSSASGSGGTIGPIHWEYPLVADHMVFMTDENGRVYAYRQK